MSEIVERVARAIIDSYHAHNGIIALEAARAAIEAMREPTECLLNEGIDATGSKGAVTSGELVAAWRGMIDAALSE